MSSSQRRYRALLRLAKDQKGTPEGDTAARVAQCMLDADQGLAAEDHEDLAPVLREFRWKTETDRDVLYHAFLFAGAEPQRWTRSRAKVLVAVEPPPVLAAIEEAYVATRERARLFLQGALSGFLLGAMPLPRRDSTGEKENDRPLDESVLDGVRAGMAAGSKVRIRRSITDGSDS